MPPGINTPKLTSPAGRAFIEPMENAGSSSDMKEGGVIGAGWRRLAGMALDVLLPPRCLGCGTMMDDIGGLCSDCWKAVDFIAPPLCERCGTTFTLESEPGALCGICAHHAPAYGRARSVFAYDAASRSLILNLKYADRTDAAPAFGRWMVRAGAELLRSADILVPVPLHWTRLFTRRYNQAALLADAVGRESGVAVLLDPLVRLRRTPSQGRMRASDRRRNLRGAIALRPERMSQVEGKNLVLVDDVLTSGATVSECAQVLYKAGARNVDVLTLARAVHPAQIGDS